jgi:hypothetical protein
VSWEAVGVKILDLEEYGNVLHLAEERVCLDLVHLDRHV